MRKEEAEELGVGMALLMGRKLVKKVDRSLIEKANQMPMGYNHYCCRLHLHCHIRLHNLVLMEVRIYPFINSYLLHRHMMSCNQNCHQLRDMKASIL
jgi:hypothetical protein